MGYLLSFQNLLLYTSAIFFKYIPFKMRSLEEDIDMAGDRLLRKLIQLTTKIEK
jgi:hypothetical protein